jgi:hypothetical protein
MTNVPWGKYGRFTCGKKVMTNIAIAMENPS